MSSVKLYNLKDEKEETVNLPKEIFEVKDNSSLLFQSIVILLSNKRSPIAHVKTRAYVSGSGKKPWKQKGTGRARAGDIRPPNWIGGGIAHGPTKLRNWSKSLSKNMRKKSLVLALSQKLHDKKIILVDKLEIKSHKTKDAQEILHKLPIKEGTILMALSDDNTKRKMAFSNLGYVNIVSSNSLNVFDIIKYDWLVLDRQAVENISKAFLDQSEGLKSSKNNLNQKENSLKAKKDQEIVKEDKKEQKAQTSSLEESEPRLKNVTSEKK